jgi:hypothetical protein
MLQDFLATSLVVCPLIFPFPIAHIYEIVGQFGARLCTETKISNNLDIYRHANHMKKN